MFVLASQLGVAQIEITQTMGLHTSHLVHVKEHQLTPKTAEAYLAMQAAAQQDGIDLQLVSAYRSYDRQQQIWEAKFVQYISNGLTPNNAIEKILTYSTIPGTSRHHWGTDIDITDGNAPSQKDVLVADKFHNNGPFEPLHRWMQENAAKYGFYLVYTNDATRTGFSYEPWHYTYLPEAKRYLETYKSRMAFAFFKSVGVKGSEHIDRDFWDDYYTQFVLGVNRELLEK